MNVFKVVAFILLLSLISQWIYIIADNGIIGVLSSFNDNTTNIYWYITDISENASIISDSYKYYPDDFLQSLKFRRADFPDDFVAPSNTVDVRAKLEEQANSDNTVVRETAKIQLAILSTHKLVPHRTSSYYRKAIDCYTGVFYGSITLFLRFVFVPATLF